MSRVKLIEKLTPAGILIGKVSEIDKGEDKFCDKIVNVSFPSFKI